MEILKLYSPLTAELEVKPDYDDYYDEPDMEQLTGAGRQSAYVLKLKMFIQKLRFFL